MEMEIKKDDQKTTDLILQTYYMCIFISKLAQSRDIFFKSIFFKELYDNCNSHERAIMDELRGTEKTRGKGIGNFGAMLMTLYAMLVIPRESFRDKYKELYNDVEAFIKRVPKDTLTDYPGEENNNPSTINFLHHIRNAVAHGRVELLESAVMFSDEKNKKLHPTKVLLAQIGERISNLEKEHEQKVELLEKDKTVVLIDEKDIESCPTKVLLAQIGERISNLEKEHEQKVELLEKDKKSFSTKIPLAEIDNILKKLEIVHKKYVEELRECK